MGSVIRAAAVMLILAAMVAAGCGGDGSADAVESSSCGTLLYEGEGEPNRVVVSDFPRSGIGAATSQQMIDAIELVFRRRDFRAGDHRVGYQSCNDTVGTEPYDPSTCRRNARAYVETDAVIAVIGPWNSGCAVEQIPIVSRRDAGPLVLVSPTNTFIGLTRTPRGAESLLPTLYPDGVRSYVRVVTHDLAQGVAAAHLAARLGARRVVSLHQDLADTYVRGLAVPFAAAARDLGLEVRQVQWPTRKSYATLAASVAKSRPDAVYLAGQPYGNAKRLIEDLRAVLGGRLLIIGPDSFAANDVVDGLGPVGEGMRVTVPGIPVDKLPSAGRAILRELGQAEPAIRGPGAPEAAQAAELVLDSIARSDGTRASVVDQLFAARVSDGILGAFSFDRFGDIVPGPVGVYRFENGKIVADGVIRTPLDQLAGVSG
jgi:branched-chain amino acid transport system substrate-binding protein